MILFAMTDDFAVVFWSTAGFNGLVVIGLLTIERAPPKPAAT